MKLTYALSLLLLFASQTRARLLREEAPQTFLTSILHINDVHARYQPATSSFGPCDLDKFGQCYGGFARLQTAADEIRARADHVLFLDAGDQFSGTLWDSLYHGQLAPIFQNLLGVQAMTVGNHECDWGADNLANYTLKTDFPILGANIDASEHPILKDTIKPYTILTLSNGVKVGVVGFSIESTQTTSSCGSSVKFSKPEEAVPSVLKELKAQGIEHIIGLSHAGYDEDMRLAALDDFKELDLIIGGHTHSFLYTGAPPQLLEGKNTTDTPVGLYPTLIQNGDKSIPVVTAFWAGRYLGHVTTEWTMGGDLISIEGSPVLMGGTNSTNPVASDPEVLALIMEYQDPVLEANRAVVGASTVNLEGDPYIIRRYETTLGNLVADAAMERVMGAVARPVADTGKQPRKLIEEAGVGHLPVITMVNAGAVRQSMPAGNITLAALSTAMPYGNWVIVKQLTGAEVMAALENAVSDLAHPAGRFVQVSGMRYAYNESAAVGERITSAVLSATDQPIAEVAELVVVMTNYMASGADGFSMLVDPPLILDTSDPLESVTAEYITPHSPVTPVVEGRIVVCTCYDGAPNCTPDDKMCS